MTLAAPTSRARIIETALDLFSQHGVAGTGMRTLAAACDLNVATLYHHFPSKDDLLRAVIADRDYLGLMQVPPPVDPSLAPRARLARLICDVWELTLHEAAIWRLLMGESLRGEPAALAVTAELAAALEATAQRWLRDHFPELDVERIEAAGSVVTGQLMGFFVEDLVAGGQPDRARLRAKAEALAELVFPTG